MHQTLIYNAELRRHQQSCTLWVPCSTRTSTAVARARRNISSVNSVIFGRFWFTHRKNICPPYIQSQGHKRTVRPFQTFQFHYSSASKLFYSVQHVDSSNDSPVLCGEHRPPSSSNKPRPKYIQHFFSANCEREASWMRSYKLLSRCNIFVAISTGLLWLLLFAAAQAAFMASRPSAVLCWRQKRLRRISGVVEKILPHVGGRGGAR